MLALRTRQKRSWAPARELLARVQAVDQQCGDALPTLMTLPSSQGQTVLRWFSVPSHATVLHRQSRPAA